VTPILALGLPGAIVGANVILNMLERAAQVALGLLGRGWGFIPG
jgi:hypothetical protein